MTVKELHSMLDKYIGTATEDYQVIADKITPDEDKNFVDVTKSLNNLGYLGIIQRRKEF